MLDLVRDVRTGRSTWGVLVLLVGAGLALACPRRDGTRKPEGKVSQIEADRYVRQAVMKSSEGVVLMPGSKSSEFDRGRLNEIAQAMRQPLAVCFLERAIRTMEKGAVDGEAGYVDVPEGQGKFRGRMGADGSVVRVEVLDSGFKDPEMEKCVMKVIGSRKFPPLRGETQAYIDVVYWVSLGFHEEAKSAAFAKHMRKQQVLAGVRAKKCLEGRVDPGVYAIEGLSLFASNGVTLINRVDHGDLAPEVSRCVAQAFKAITIAPEQDAFVRPAAPKVEFTVREDGVVEVGDQRWLELVELEERARREQKRRELSSGEASADPPASRGGKGSPFDVTISGLEPGVDDEEREDTAAAGAGEANPPTADPVPPAQDPGQRGIKLDLGPRR